MPFSEPNIMNKIQVARRDYLSGFSRKSPTVTRGYFRVILFLSNGLSVNTVSAYYFLTVEQPFRCPKVFLKLGNSVVSLFRSGS